MFPPDEEIVYGEIKERIEAFVPELVGKISPPTDVAPAELSAIIYVGPHTASWDGMEVGGSQISVVIATPRGQPYIDHHRLCTRMVGEVYKALKVHLVLTESDGIITGPVTIGTAGIGQFRPGGTETISCTITIGVDYKGELEVND